MERSFSNYTWKIKFILPPAEQGMKMEKGAGGLPRPIGGHCPSPVRGALLPLDR